MKRVFVRIGIFIGMCIIFPYLLYLIIFDLGRFSIGMVRFGEKIKKGIEEELKNQKL